MSKKGLVTDEFKPKAIDGVQTVEIKSKHKPRSYVLIHPKTKHIESLGVKDYFFWKQLKGEKTLAQLKQDYYQKFKALPTQHITEITLKWLEIGLIENDREKPKREGRKKKFKIHFEATVPMALLRNIFGPIGLLLCNPIFSIVWAILLLVSFGGLMVLNGPLVFFDAFAYQYQTSWLILGIIASLYIFALMRLILRMGTLYKKPRFIGDQLKIGLYLIFPTIRATRRGLLLKSWEERLYDLVASWVFPAAISGTLFFTTSLIEGIPPLYQYLAAILALAGIIDLILCSCPFFTSTLIAMLNEYIGGFNIYNLTKLYFKNHNQFLEDRSRTETRAVFGYLGIMFFWVVFGSSFLLLTTSKMAEGLTTQLNTTTNLDNDTIQYIQYALYAPIFIAFIVLLWKLIQPYIEHVKQKAFWNEPHTMGIGLSVSAILLGVTYFFLPDQFARLCIAAVCFTHLMTIPKATPGVPVWLKAHSAFLISNYAILTGQILFPQFQFFSIILGVLWLIWHINAIRSIAPKSATWIGIVALSTVIFTALFAVVPFMLGISLSHNLIFLACASLALSIFIWTWGGGIGLFFSLDAMAMLFLFLASSFELPNALAEAASVTAFFFLYFQYRGTSRFIRHSVDRITDFIDTQESGGDSRGIENTMSNFLSHCLGEFTVNSHQKQSKKNKFLLNTYAQWLIKWLPMDNVVDILRIALTSIEWEERPSFDERVNGLNLTAVEKKSGMTLEKRIQFLRNQLMFKGFKKSELKEIALHLELSVYKSGANIVTQDEPAHNYLEIISHGSALMEQSDMNGVRHTLAEIGTGDAIRSEDLFKTGPYDSSIVCTKDVVTLRLYRNHFIQWYQANPGALERVMESISLAQMIMKLSLFRDFTPAQVRLVMERLKKKTAKPGETIIKQGEEGDEFYLLDKGQVDIIVGDNKVAQLGSGSYFGEIALLEKCKRTASVVASAKSSLFSLEQQDFEHFFSSGRSAQVLKNVSSKRTNN